jgi:hypothetical protein
MSVTIPLLQDLQGPWRELQIEFYGSGTETVEAYPFISVTDLKRIIWMTKEGAPEWAPARVFIGVRTGGGFRPIEFHWPADVADTVLPDPMTFPGPNPALVNAQGVRKPVSPVMLGGLILEEALAPELPDIPTITVISLASLQGELTPVLFGGFYVMYFPWLTDPAEVESASQGSDAIADTYALDVPYTLDRNRRITAVQEALAAGHAGDSITMTTMARLRWVVPFPRPESLEQMFYRLPTTTTIPFMRYFPATPRSPLLKLALNADGTPIISNERLLARFLHYPPPVPNVIVAKIPIAGSQALTMVIFDDGSCDITLEVPQRGATYLASVATDAEELLRRVLDDFGIAARPLLRDIHATYQWTHPNPDAGAGLSAGDIKKRLAALTPFLDAAGESFRWRAVSNYESESEMFAFITSMVEGGEVDVGDGAPNMEKVASGLMTQFGIKGDAARTVVERWLERKAKAVAPSIGTGFMAVPKHSAGTSVAIRGDYPSYSLEIQGADSLQEVQRLASVVGVLLGAPTLGLVAPPQIMIDIAAIVQQQGEGDGGDDGLSDLGDLGFGSDEEGDEGAAEAAAEAAPVNIQPVACRTKPWLASDAPLKALAKYYITKLSGLDPQLFSYEDPDANTKAKGAKEKQGNTYSRRCGTVEGRQPNVFTEEQYRKIRGCYEGRARFVDLPPRTPDDLPASHDGYITDTTGLPIWTVYNYVSKSPPHNRLFLTCAEFWCAKESCNMPLLRSEFEGTARRDGFDKDPMTCPFCGGRPIRDMSVPGPQESVIVRKKKDAETFHRFIGLIKEATHPLGYPYPCCGIKPTLINAYKEGTFGEEVVEAVGTVDYKKIFASMKKQYILDSDKMLTAGKIGLVPPFLDDFFGQDSPQSIKLVGVRPTFHESAVLFVHVGVDTRARGLSLFAGLAPLLGYNSSEECKLALIERISPRAFESANYGTLVHEFAAQNTLTETDVAKSLPEFAAKYGYNLDLNRPHTMRLYRAYIAFLAYLADDQTPKQLRHLEHLLTGLARMRLVVLERTDSRTAVAAERPSPDSRTAQVDVLCPTFGLTDTESPVSFLWHDKRDDTWEPLILYNDGEAVLTFGNGSPPSIKTWLRDWTGQCVRPPPPHVWSLGDADLPRLTTLLTARLSLKPTALLRVRSNRLAGVMFGGLFVPCLDDGNLAPQMPRLFETDAIPDTPIDEYERFYAELRLPIVAQLTRGGVVGFLMGTGTMVPCGPGASALPEQQVEAFPWERDAILRPADAMGSTAVLEEQKVSVEEQAAEAYQYLRLSMGRYLNGAGQGLKEAILKLIRRTKPLYVKRQEMDVLLEPVVRMFIEVVVTDRRAALPLLRPDCIPLDEEGCRTGCTWVQSCKIAVPQRGATDSIRIFTARLSDEFLRYPSRAEILDNRVATIRTPKTAIRVGDELIMPTKKKEPADLILERLGFTGLRPAVFPEELLRLEGIEETVVGPPALWADMGFRVIVEDRNVVLAAITQIPIETWATSIVDRKVKLGLPSAAFSWSLQDMYAIASLKTSTVLLVSREGVQMIRPPVKPAPDSYMFFWDYLLVSRGDTYRFRLDQLPSDVAMAVESTTPLSLEELGSAE